MWRVFLVIGYFALALLIPLTWMAVSVWRKARRPRAVVCPDNGSVSIVGLDSWHAVRMHALGNPEPFIERCSLWRDGAVCEQDCREQLGRTV
jgi:hypothetical protein